MSFVSDFIDLDRHFFELDENERKKPQALAMLEAWGDKHGTNWQVLLDTQRVVLLAEAGSGKTAELKHQARLLQALGKPAFFVPVEDLQNQGLTSLLASNAALLAQFEAWKADTSDLAWFFLDAVDELKLTHGKLRQALQRVAAAIGVAKSRARVVITCRPSDWQPISDLEEFETLLPPTDNEGPPQPNEEDSFLVPFTEPRSAKKDEKAEGAAKLRVVGMLPLDTRRIRKFAEARGVSDADNFMSELHRAESQSFARRPLDLERLTRFWKQHRRFGSRLEQHEDDVVEALKDNPARADAGVLSTQRLREGAERLALALLLTGKLGMAAQEQALGAEGDSGILDTAAVLGEWTQTEISALLRRGLFDPATYGRVRFHHRSVMEYLAAKRLNTLVANGLPKRELLQLNFSETYGERIVIPSRQPVAAWLALWQEDIRRELLARQPELLILHGDAGSLPIEIRIQLLRAYTDAYGEGDWRGLDLPVGEIARVAHPELADVVRECWARNSSNKEIQQLLLKIIWQGKIAALSDVSLPAAMDDGLGYYERTLAIRALHACEDQAALAVVARDLFDNPSRWPDRTVHYSVASLYPRHLTTAELAQIVTRTREPRNTIGGFQWELFESVAPELIPFDPVTTEFREMLCGMIWSGKNGQRRGHKEKTDFSHLAPALVRVCLNQLRAGIEDTALVRAAVIAHRFHADGVAGREELKELTDTLRQRDNLRPILFDQDFALAVRLARRETDHGLMFATLYEGVLNDVEQADWTWLLERLAPSYEMKMRGAVLQALLQLWWRRGDDDANRQALLSATADSEAFRAIIFERTDKTPKPPSQDDLEHEAFIKRHERERKQRDKKIQQSWADWKAKLEADPQGQLEGKKRDSKVMTLVEWLGYSDDGYNSIARHNWRDIRKTLGDDIGSRFEVAAKALWRQSPPRPNSKRKAKDANSFYTITHSALTGLLIESVDHDWAKKLTAAEAEVATHWAVHEMNGWPEWMEALAIAHPDAVKLVLVSEMKWELSGDAGRDFPRVTSATKYGPVAVRQLLLPTIRSLLKNWPDPPKGDDKRLSGHLGNAQRLIQILAEQNGFDAELESQFKARFHAEPTSPMALSWLLGLFHCNPDAGASSMQQAAKKLRIKKRREHGQLWLAGLFGDHDRSGPPINLDGHVQVLRYLVPLAYELVQTKDDVHHEGTYSPGPRDYAERARGHVLGALLECRGPGAHAAIIALSRDPQFGYMADRLRERARYRAALDSEPRPFAETELSAWESGLARIPRSRDELFVTMMNRLNDIEHDTLHGDFNDRADLQAILRETEMQPRIARKLHDSARGHYQVTREDEVADKKEPDIRLVASGFEGKAAIEIKLGDNWSVRELEAAIRDQLVAQYLRHSGCLAGCLLVTYSGRKGFDHPETGAKMSFDEVIRHLSAYAETLEAEETGRIRLGVTGLDLRPPLGLGK